MRVAPLRRCLRIGHGNKCCCRAAYHRKVACSAAIGEASICFRACRTAKRYWWAGQCHN